MAKLNRHDYRNYGILFLILIVIVLAITHGEYLFGSTVDWGVQHWAFAEYFRNLFYQTFDFFPDFAFNIGGGQNIYYFAYYGLLSPIILLSYLLPMVPMYTYIMASSIVILLLSVFLFYLFLKKHGFSKNLCLVLSVLFLCAGPLIFHSHRHVMFVNYMPFLILGLFGVDLYFKNGKKYLLIISTFLMIMTSYFYSVGGIFCLVIYGVYVYLKTSSKFVFKDFIKAGLKFVWPILVAVLLSLVLLLPTLYAIINGRIESVNDTDLFSVLLPSLNLDFILYKSYAVGLTGIVIIALLVNLLTKKKHILFLNIALLSLIVFPIFVYILNGALYLDGKALIPFLPLYCLVIGMFLQSILNKEVPFKKILFLTILAIILGFLSFDSLALYFMVDALFLLLVIYLYYKKNNEYLLIIPVMVVSFAVCLGVNFGDDLISKDDFEKQVDVHITDLVKEITNDDKSIYRIALDLEDSELINRVLDSRAYMTSLYSSTYNTYYNNFYYEEFNNNRSSRNMFITKENQNVLFQSLMGVKYLITDKEAPLGYELLYEKYGYKVYQNKMVLPLGYVTDNLMNNETFEKMEFPFNVEYLLSGAVVSSGKNIDYNGLSSEIDLDLKNLENKEDGFYVVEGEQDIEIKLDGDYKDKLVLLRIMVDNPQNCSDGDTYIEVNDIRNKLTCAQWKYFNSNYSFDYTLSNINDTITLHFSKGVHYIKSIEAYALDLDEVNSDIDEFIINYNETKGDKIVGSVTTSKDGYFITSIPYDEGFNVMVDGKEINYEMVNNGFLGFALSSGEHNIEIEYEAPWANLGKIGSIIGLICFVITLIFDRKMKKC